MLSLRTPKNKSNSRVEEGAGPNNPNQGLERQSCLGTEKNRLSSVDKKKNTLGEKNVAGKVRKR